MAQITFKGNPAHTVGELPPVGSTAPDFTLVNGQLEDKRLSDYAGTVVVLSIVPSLDTGVCAASTRIFNQRAAGMANTQVLVISADLPFAQGRFCEAEGIDQVESLSCFRAPTFGTSYGVTIADGPLAGLLSRAVLVVDGNGSVIYTEQVPEIAQEPDYDAALNAIPTA